MREIVAPIDFNMHGELATLDWFSKEPDASDPGNEDDVALKL